MPLASPHARPRHATALAITLALSASVAGLASARGASAATDAPDPRYSLVDGLNLGLPPTDDPPDLETPQAALESFIDASRGGDFGRAARVLNLNAFPPSGQAEAGTRLAREMFELMNQQVWFKWSDVPDRPDGEGARPGRRVRRGWGRGAQRPRPRRAGGGRGGPGAAR